MAESGGRNLRKPIPQLPRPGSLLSSLPKNYWHHGPESGYFLQQDNDLFMQTFIQNSMGESFSNGKHSVVCKISRFVNLMRNWFLREIRMWNVVCQRELRNVYWEKRTWNIILSWNRKHYPTLLPLCIVCSLNLNMMKSCGNDIILILR